MIAELKYKINHKSINNDFVRTHFIISIKLLLFIHLFNKFVYQDTAAMVHSQGGGQEHCVCCGSATSHGKSRNSAKVRLWRGCAPALGEKQMHTISLLETYVYFKNDTRDFSESSIKSILFHTIAFVSLQLLMYDLLVTDAQHLHQVAVFHVEYLAQLPDHLQGQAMYLIISISH